MQEAAWLVGQASNDRVLYDELPPASAGTVVQASYSRPYVAHASMGPSCALAEFRNGQLEVWSHTQGAVSAARGAGQRAGHAGGQHHRAARAWRRLLRS